MALRKKTDRTLAGRTIIQLHNFDRSVDPGMFYLDDIYFGYAGEQLQNRLMQVDDVNPFGLLSVMVMKMI